MLCPKSMACSRKKNGFTLDHFTVSAFMNMFGKYLSEHILLFCHKPLKENSFQQESKNEGYFQYPEITNVNTMRLLAFMMCCLFV